MPITKGQKLTDDPRNVRLEVRLTQSENVMLTETAEALKTTKTAVIVEGIKQVNSSLPNK